MNNKNNILDSWIMIEQLSEGDIKISDDNIRLLVEQNDYLAFFKNFMQQNSANSKYSKNNSGVAIYFSIFDSREIIKILEKTFNIPQKYSEKNNTHKFSFVLYFDQDFNLINDKTFYTMTGYLYNKYKNIKFPEDLKDFQQDYKNFLQNEEDKKQEKEEFFLQQGFHRFVQQLCNKYGHKKEKSQIFTNIRYQYVSDIDRDNTNMHSFFIEDLKLAKTINDNKILNRYLGKPVFNKYNLDSKKTSTKFNPKLLDNILQPKYYPLGRFPSNTEYALSLMQQVAVNLAVSDNSDYILSVNGPPGTGKTTLLKDVFADLQVQQAYSICKLSNKELKGELEYCNKGETCTLAVLPKNISDKNIVVASSNNGAVQNIVNELPKISELDNSLLDEVLQSNYFFDVANGKQEWNDENKKYQITPLEKKKFWGTFSLEGGKSENRKNILNTVDMIYKKLNNVSINTDAYDKFMDLYKDVEKERDIAQDFKEKIDKLEECKSSYEKKQESYHIQKQEKEDTLARLRENNNKIIDNYRQENTNYKKLSDNYKLEEVALNQDIEHLNQKYERFLSQKPFPFLFWFFELINSKRIRDYKEQLFSLNVEIDKTNHKKRSIVSELNKLSSMISSNDSAIESLQNEIVNYEQSLVRWIKTTNQDLNLLNTQITHLTNEIDNSQIEKLDLSKPYADLQKSNAWFDRSFREKQSRLFILALAVKKQFLRINNKNILGSKIIWDNLDTYKDETKLVTEAWQWINFCIPVISTTFASFGNMFRYVDVKSIGHLFIDEAGQAVPQALVAGCIKSKKIVAVGDPKQIEPVVTLDPGMLSIIGKNYKTEQFVSATTSVQTLLDLVSRYGFQYPDESWVGIPLWVHRRCKSPMFDISNNISYEGLMVQGIEHAQGLGEWYDQGGKANDKFVQEQSKLLQVLIQEKMNQGIKKEQIYVISPFKNVAYKLAQQMKGFTMKGDDGKPTNVGTVHTFQGKEADIVYLVLGADEQSKGAAIWAVSEANIMNVAATRAKKEFYIIGDKKLYRSIGTNVVNITMNIIDGNCKIK